MEDKTIVSKDQKTEAIIKAIKSFPKHCRYMSAKERKQIEDDIYETTRVSIDNLTSDDL
jgi:hypothetical protein